MENATTRKPCPESELSLLGSTMSTSDQINGMADPMEADPESLTPRLKVNEEESEPTPDTPISPTIPEGMEEDSTLE